MNKLRKISILCGSFPPETGAAPGRILLLATLLQQQGYEVQVITTVPNYPKGKIFPGYRGKWRTTEMYQGISVTRIWFVPTNSSRKIKRALSLFSLAAVLQVQLPGLLRKHAPDLLLVSSPPFLLGTIGTKLAARKDIPLLLNVSDLWPGSAQELGFVQDGALLRYLKQLETGMYMRATAFCVQSEEIAAHIRQYRSEAPLFVYRNLQPLSPFAHNDRPSGKRKLVYAGLLGVAQGVAGIIRHLDFAAAGTELHIYGDGNERKTIETLASERNDIFYHGSVPATAIPEILSQYHIMLVPLVSKIEGAVPSKIFNAVANGLPLLYMGSGESQQIVREHRLGYACDAGDLPSLGINLKRMITLDEKAFQQLRDSCLHAAEHLFSKEVQDRRFIDFLTSLQC